MEAYKKMKIRNEIKLILPDIEKYFQEEIDGKSGMSWKYAHMNHLIEGIEYAYDTLEYALVYEKIMGKKRTSNRKDIKKHVLTLIINSIFLYERVKDDDGII